jgi:hypothetical protein
VLVLMAHLLGCVQAGIAVFRQEPEKIVELDKVQLARLATFRSRFVRDPWRPVAEVRNSPTAFVTYSNSGTACCDI